MSITKTTCPYCGVGCGVVARVRGTAVEVEGDLDHPANFGRLCVKGSALGETVGLDGRLLHPRVRDGDGYRNVSWDDALDRVASGFRRIIDTHGPEAVAFYVSGQILTEDYYVANKLMKGYIGTANIDTNSRLCMSSAVAGHQRAFGEDFVPVSYEDFESADLVVLVGSNTAWCHPVLYQRLVRAREQRPDMRIVVVDPRRTPTCELADLHVPIASGTDVWLFNGLLRHLHEHGQVDRDFVDAHTQGFDDALAACTLTLAETAKRCGIDAGLLEQFYALFAQTPKAVTAFSQGVNQSSAGTDKVNSIINVHLATGRIGKPGAGPFSITGQPNAMGGREVGGLATMLAAHLQIGDAKQRSIARRFWDSPRIADKPGLKAVDMFRAIEDGRIKAVWIMSTNPVVSLPEADQVKRALAACELVVVSEVLERTDTSVFAHVQLPATAWGEKDGTVTNSERRISRQRAFLPAPGEARADWWALAEVGKRMGYAGFDFADARAVFDEHARLSAFENDDAGVRRFFDLGGLVGLTPEQYDQLQPVRWPASTASSDCDRKPFHGRARFVTTAPRPPAHAPSEDFPFVLNTGRIRDQWHTMTRSGRSPRLSSHLPEPYAEIHPADALLCGVRELDLVRVSTRWGSMVVRARLSAEQRRGNVFVPIHWNAQTASDGRVGALVNPVVDPVSGEPEFKHTPARVEPFAVDWHGFVLTRTAGAAIDDLSYWVRVQGPGFVRHELAGRGRVGDWSAWARTLLGAPADADWLEYLDAASAEYRAAWIVDERLEACVFVAPRPQDLSRGWIGGLFARDRLAPAERLSVLAGAPPSGGGDPGPALCSCHGVGRNVIRRAIRQEGLDSVKALGQRTRAGTQCGSCIPELTRLLAECRAQTA